MDLRSMLNESHAAKPPAPTTPTSQPKQTPKNVQSNPNYSRNDSQPPPYPTGFRERPPDPPPIHTSNPRSPTGSSSYHSAQSPYQHTSASTVSSGPHSSIHSANSSHGQPQYLQSARDPYTSHVSPYTQQFIPSPSPFTPPVGVQPPQQFPQHQRTTSTHSVTTPLATYGQSYVPHESPVPAGASPHSQTQQFPSIHHQHSQPGTPLGPPMSYQRPSPQAHRPSSAGYDHYRSYSSGTHGPPHASENRERSITSPGVRASPVQQSRERPSLPRQYSTDREKSESVSPKTIPPTLSRQATSENQSDLYITPVKRKVLDDTVGQHPSDNRGMSTPVSSAGTPIHQPMIDSRSSSARRTPPPPTQSVPQAITNTALPNITSSPVHGNLPTQQPALKREASALSASSTSSQLPPRKRQRNEAVPIFAQSVRGRKAINANKRSAPGPVQHVLPQSVARQETNGRGLTPSVVANGETGPLVKWEPSIVNTIPYEELTRAVTDFLYLHVVREPAPADGAHFEIEAKLGHLIDPGTGQRVDLPVKTECELDTNRMRVQFHSSMSLHQHEKMNKFLNNCTGESKMNSADRVEIYYKHIRETDTFYELSHEGIQFLPPTVRQHLQLRRHTPRVRITRDNTGRETGRIIKSRVVDMDIFSPKTDFDYRISVNVESPFTGDDQHLVPIDARTSGNRADSRQKDRMSYRHQEYQIDLTQVTTSSGTREHELEIEISPEQVKLQGELARAMQPHRYEELIRGFVDNIRVLLRAVSKKDA